MWWRLLRDLRMPFLQIKFSPTIRQAFGPAQTLVTRAFFFWTSLYQINNWYISLTAATSPFLHISFMPPCPVFWFAVSHSLFPSLLWTVFLHLFFFLQSIFFLAIPNSFLVSHSILFLFPFGFSLFYFPTSTIRSKSNQTRTWYFASYLAPEIRKKQENQTNRLHQAEKSVTRTIYPLLNQLHPYTDQQVN